MEFHLFLKKFKETLTITGFVLVMMLLIEYFNILTQGDWQIRSTHLSLTQNVNSFAPEDNKYLLLIYPLKAFVSFRLRKFYRLGYIYKIIW